MSEIKENKIIEERKKKLLKLVKNKFLLTTYAILAIIIWINIKIRSLPIPGLKDVTTGDYTLGPDLDPFLFLRYAKNIVAQGKLFTIDIMRYTPFGYNTAQETQLLPYTIAWLYKIINVFGDYSVTYAAIILPVVASIFTAIFFFLLVRKIFESKGEKVSNIIALIATSLMVVLPSLLTRTIAGIPEKESLGFGLMFLAFYLFISAWKSKSIKNALILGIFSGIVTALMGLVWGGVIFIYSSIAIVGFIALMLGKVDRKELIVYASWLLASALFWIPFTQRTTLKSFVTSSTSGTALIIFGFILVYFILFKTKIKENKYLQNSNIKKIPPQILAIIITLILGFIIGVLFLGPTNVIGIGQDIFSKLASPYSDRLSYTVAENKQPYFSDWGSSMGPNFKGIPLFFWMFFVGSIYLFMEMIKKLKNKEKLILNSSYIFFLFALIFSRNSSSSKYLNGESGFSWFIYILGYIILIAGTGYVFYQRYQNKELSELKNIKFEYLFLFTMSFIGIIAARSAVRLIMTLTPIAAIIIAYFVVEITSKTLKEKDKTKKIFLWIAVIVLILALIFTWNVYYNISKSIATNNIPQSYQQQWQNAMFWVRENTPENAVFGHWWDYGYWLQSIGDRATMLDGGNAIVYWNYLMGRHGLTAESETEALELFYNHNVTHFLIDSSDVGKYSAYSLIGSDENYDRYSTIGTFLLDDSQIQETNNQTILVYPGGINLDEDLIIKKNGREILLPKQSVVAGVLAYLNQDGTYGQPDAIIYYNNNQYKLPLRYLYVDERLIDFGSEKENTISGCAYLFPRLNMDGSASKFGANMYLSPRNMRALWVRIYLLGEEKNFKLVHSEPSSIHTQYLIPNKIDIGDFVYFQGLQGPIKIWEIRYNGNEKVNKDYLALDYPENVANRRWR